MNPWHLFLILWATLTVLYFGSRWAGLAIRRWWVGTPASPEPLKRGPLLQEARIISEAGLTLAQWDALTNAQRASARDAYYRSRGL